MMSYGGIPLAAVTPDWASAVAYYLKTDRTTVVVPEVQFADWNAAAQRRLSYAAPGVTPMPSVMLGRLYWPMRASRFAVAHVLATDTMLASIQQQVYGLPSVLPTSGSYRPTAYNALPFVMDDGQVNVVNKASTPKSITTNLYMLPPKPLAQPLAGSDPMNGMWLLTLVDDRYFWWQRTGSITVDEGTTTWADLLTAILTALGIFDVTTVDTIADAYLPPVWPPKELANQYDYLPPLLDAVARSIGQRIVRTLAGDVLSQSADSARTTQTAQVGSYGKEFGGTRLLTAS
jgi:hypothetical protein